VRRAPPAGKQPRALWRGLVFIASLVAFGYLLNASGLGVALNEDWIDAEVRDKGLSGELLFLAIGALATAAGLPRQLVSFLAGYAFDVVPGSLLALLATVLGGVVAFGYARFFGRDIVRHRFARRFGRMDRFLRQHPFSMFLLIRLLPVGNNLVTNLAAGVSRVNVVPFVAGSAIGYVPQTVVFALIGSGVNIDPWWRIGLGVVLFVASSAIGVWLYHHHHRRGANHGREF
jgi:uncharacterized membrane protein YdjX (TVP38/TMEM64 family)